MRTQLYASSSSIGFLINYAGLSESKLTTGEVIVNGLCVTVDVCAHVLLFLCASALLVVCVPLHSYPEMAHTSAVILLFFVFQIDF